MARDSEIISEVTIWRIYQQERSANKVVKESEAHRCTVIDKYRCLSAAGWDNINALIRIIYISDHIWLFTMHTGSVLQCFA